eukprot:9484443-Pyramimonas_sp.AAC.1
MRNSATSPSRPSQLTSPRRGSSAHQLRLQSSGTPYPCRASAICSPQARELLIAQVYPAWQRRAGRSTGIPHVPELCWNDLCAAVYPRAAEPLPSGEPASVAVVSAVQAMAASNLAVEDLETAAFAAAALPSLLNPQETAAS